MTVDPISESLKRLVKYFEMNKIPYVVVGGVSVFVLGRSRFTMDVDIILDHTKLDTENFVTYLKENNFDASVNDFEGFDEKTHCSFFFKTGMFRMDIKGVYSDLDAESISMAINGIYNGIKIKINNPANLILFKLKFGSEQDYEDAISVYIRHKEKIDLKFLKEKAQKMQISSNLDSFLEEIRAFLEKEGIQ
ncbi:MAG: nucleotidyltransferase [Candidatus Heimdallarchaeaceae archaeon]